MKSNVGKILNDTLSDDGLTLQIMGYILNSSRLGALDKLRRRFERGTMSLKALNQGVDEIVEIILNEMPPELRAMLINANDHLSEEDRVRVGQYQDSPESWNTF